MPPVGEGGCRPRRRRGPARRPRSMTRTFASSHVLSQRPGSSHDPWCPYTTRIGGWRPELKLSLDPPIGALAVARGRLTSRPGAANRGRLLVRHLRPRTAHGVLERRTEPVPSPTDHCQHRGRGGRNFFARSHHNKPMENSSMEGSLGALLVPNVADTTCVLDGFMLPPWHTPSGPVEPVTTQAKMAHHVLTYERGKHVVLSARRRRPGERQKGSRRSRPIGTARATTGPLGPGRGSRPRKPVHRFARN